MPCLIVGKTSLRCHGMCMRQMESLRRELVNLNRLASAVGIVEGWGVEVAFSEGYRYLICVI